jgi:RNA 2',3'-cyclic 3'-phosphodiesterase
MLLYAVIVPPREVLVAVARVVRSVERPSAPGPSAPRRGLRARLGGRGAPAVEPAAAAHELELISAEQMNLPITGFGNVTTGDARRLTEVISTAATGWAPPTMCFTGGTALEKPGDRSVWVGLEGDVAALMTIAKGVTQSVEPLGFFVDRRKFRPSMAVGTVTEHTTTEYLQSVLDALDAFRGEPWTVEHVLLTRKSFDAGAAMPEEVARIPISSA